MFRKIGIGLVLALLVFSIIGCGGGGGGNPDGGNGGGGISGSVQRIFILFCKSGDSNNVLVFSSLTKKHCHVTM